MKIFKSDIEKYGYARKGNAERALRKSIYARDIKGCKVVNRRGFYFLKPSKNDCYLGERLYGKRICELQLID